MILLLTLGGGLLNKGAVHLPGGRITGPAIGRVGELATFTHSSDDVVWVVDGVTSSGSVLTLAFAQPGPLDISASSGIWKTELTVIVTEPDSSLAILSEPSVEVGRSLLLEASGSSASEYTWTVKRSNGEFLGTSTGPTITFEAAFETGLVVFEVVSSNGERAERTINVIKALD